MRGMMLALVVVCSASGGVHAQAQLTDADLNGMVANGARENPDHKAVVYSAAICARAIQDKRSHKWAHATVAAVASRHDKTPGNRALDSDEAWTKRRAWEVRELRKRAKAEGVKLAGCGGKAVATLAKCYSVFNTSIEPGVDCATVADYVEADAEDVMQIDGPEEAKAGE